MLSKPPKHDFYSKYRPGKCRAKDPRTCPFHGRAAREKEAFYKEVLAAQRKKEDEAKNATFVADLDASLKARTLKDGTRVVTVYRAGVLSAPEERGVEKESYLAADKYAPEGRQGRTTGVFAAPSLGGVARWVKGIHFAYQRLDVRVRAINVNPDTTYIYSVRAWEIASSGFDRGGERAVETAKAYWDSGMTLTEWESKVRAGEVLDPKDWEMLLPASVAEDDLNPKGPRIVPPKHVADQAYYGSDEVLSILKDFAKFYREPRAPKKQPVAA